jgi:EmrB/QacA subfamily drug resistance transporter
VDRHRWLVLSAVSVGTFMATLDGSIVNIALPSIGRAFGIDLATVQWVVVAYLLVVGSLLLPFGRLGEVLSFRRVYLAGFAVFTVASAVCGAAPGPGALVAARAVQGVGAAMLMAMGPAIIARTFGPGERGRALGLNAVSVAIGLSLGPALGGLLTEVGTWRAIFYINVPVGIFAILWAARVLPPEPPGRRQAFDVPGAVLSATGFFALLLALNQGELLGWTSPPVAALLVLAAALGVAFLAVERHSPAPMIDLRLFEIRAFSAGLAAVVVAFAGLFTATFLLPFLLQEGSGYTPLEAGLLLTPIPITAALVAPFSGALSDRIGQRVPASIGIAVLVLGLLSLTTLPEAFTVGELTWRLALIGAGQGLFLSPNSSSILGSVPRPRLGTASGMIAQMRVVGQAFGIVISGAVVAVRLPAHLAALEGLPAGEAQREALVLAIHDAFIVAALICGIGIVASLLRGPAAPSVSQGAVAEAEPSAAHGS